MTPPKLTKSHIRAIRFLPRSGAWAIASHGAPDIRTLAKDHPGLCNMEIGDLTVVGITAQVRLARLTPAGIAVKAALEAKP